jgi:lipopolysaccharide/colanic/teichoic acid biosynthesis glycosyltransferase
MQTDSVITKSKVEEKPELAISVQHPYNRASYQTAKRVFDFVVAFVGLLLLLPVFLAVWMAIYFQDGGPVVFKQRRLKQNGTVFYIFKFRSMVNNAEEILRSSPELMAEYQRTFKIANDPRLLKIGRFIRSTSIDELPQLINVIYGDMSLVGPRPIVEREIENYGEYADVYLSMKPGCAGLWQCSGRSNTTYAERIALDMEYREKATIWFDVQILWLTLISVFRRNGAH